MSNEFDVAVVSPKAQDREIFITREKLRGAGVCEIGFKAFVRAERKHGRKFFELQELLDIIAAATPADDPKRLAYWYAYWLLATFGYYPTTLEVDRLDCAGHFFYAGSLVVRGDANIGGYLVTGGHCHIGRNLTAKHIQLAGRLEVGGDIRARNRIEATEIHAGGSIESSHSFIHADKGDVSSGEYILSAGEVAADVGFVRCRGDLVSGQGVYAKGQFIGGMLQVINPAQEANPELLLPALPPELLGLAALHNRAARRKLPAGSRKKNNRGKGRRK